MKPKSIIAKAVTFRSLAVVFSFALVFTGCKKYLDAKPDLSITTPSTVEDLEGIINNYAFINARYPSAAEVSSDNYYLKPADFTGILEVQRNFYTWQKYDLIGGDYSSPYSAIEYANIILDALPKVSSSETDRINAVRGNALFIRASYHFALAQIYCKVYNRSSAANDRGIALRFTSDVAIKPVRSSIAATYAAIIDDLNRSLTLLPAIADVKYHASKCAAFGMLARTYLAMSDFGAAANCADSSLSIYSKLINYNSVSKTSAIPFTQFNNEVIYDARTSAPQALAPSRAKVDTTLFNSFAANDLRKTVFFKANPDGSYAFKGNYTGQNNASIFTGISTDELYLIRSECAVRLGRVNDALASLNTLLVNRWRTGTYINVTTTDKDQLLNVILNERRKELAFRNLRWVDLRRLNQEPAFSKTLTRRLNGDTYVLTPGSERYVIQLDRSAVDISGLEQNP